MHRRILITDVIIALAGVGIFIAGDAIASPSLRLAGFVVVVIGAVTAAILTATTRKDD